MLTKVKEMLAKATGTVTGLIKKRGSNGSGAPANETADGTATENAQKMKAAVEAARNGKDEA